MARDVCQTQRVMKRKRGQPSLDNPAFCTREAVPLRGPCDNLRHCYNKTMAYLESRHLWQAPQSDRYQLRSSYRYVATWVLSSAQRCSNRHANDALRQHHESHLWALAVRGERNGCRGQWDQCFAQQTRLACTGHKRSESRCNPCVSSALAPTDMFTCHNEESELLCNPNTST